MDLYDYSTLANKWKFEQMERFAENTLQLFREQMEIRTNGKTPPAFSTERAKWKGFLAE